MSFKLVLHSLLVSTVHSFKGDLVLLIRISVRLSLAEC